ncbi:MAG: hypothetical protein AAF517_24200 [Planctomycetota bacterium]
MLTRILAVVVLVSVGVLGGTRRSAAGEESLIHLQTDRPSYRLGERIWYRVHESAPRVADSAPRMVVLCDAEGVELEWREVSATSKLSMKKSSKNGASKKRTSKARRANDGWHGSFVIPEKGWGGTYHLRLKNSSSDLHVVPLDVYDLAVPNFELGLDVVTYTAYPGEKIEAVFRARDLRGRPIVKAQIEYLLRVNGAQRRGQAGVTDSAGRAVLRIELPKEARGKGDLSVGILHRRAAGAVSRSFRVTSPVASVEAFPEGGTIAQGLAQRFGLLIRDESGEGIPTSGRIVDDDGNSVGGFESGADGLASTVVTYEEGRTYHVEFDRPKGLKKTFSMPAYEGHEYSMHVEETSTHFEVRTNAPSSARLRLVQAGTTIADQRVKTQLIQNRSEERIPTKFSKDGRGGFADLVLDIGTRVFARRTVYLGAGAPTRVELHPAKGSSRVVGEEAVFVLRTFRGKNPVPAEVALSVYQGERSDLPTIATRAALGADDTLTQLPRSFFAPESAQRRDTFLIVHRAFQFPKGGIERSRSEKLTVQRELIRKPRRIVWKREEAKDPKAAAKKSPRPCRPG